MSDRADADAGGARFWELAEPLLKGAAVTRSTMMGFPCLRLHGDFFATCDRHSVDAALTAAAARSGATR